MTKRRLVLDTNIVISAALWPHSTPSKALKKALKDCTVLCSAASLSELRTRLLDRRFDPYATYLDRHRFIVGYAAEMEPVTVTTVIKACRDSKDNFLLALAVDGQADCLLTGNKDLLALHPFQGISIITAADFLN